MAVTKGMSPTGTAGVLNAKGRTSGAVETPRKGRRGRRKGARKSKRY